jgi:hypothetical protein
MTTRFKCSPLFPLVKNPNLKAILYRSLLVFHREHQFNNSFGQSYYFVTTAIPLHKSFTTFEGEIQSKKMSRTTTTHFNLILFSFKIC